MRYVVTVTGDADIEADNVMQAAQVAKRLRLIPTMIGSRRISRHDKELSRYGITVFPLVISRPKRDPR